MGDILGRGEFPEVGEIWETLLVRDVWEVASGEEVVDLRLGFGLELERRLL